MPTPENPGRHQVSRAQELISFVREEIRLFQSSEIRSISTNEELRERFGYEQTSSFYPLLRKEGLIFERRMIRARGGYLKQGAGYSLTPSYECSWMIGILAGGGSVAPTGVIAISETDSDFLDIVKSRGERLFGIHGFKDTLRIKADGSPYQYIHFHNRGLARQFGDLRRHVWPQTVLDRHHWIIEDSRYIAGLLEGIFDTRGLVDPSKVIILLTSYPNIANFLAELLIRIGIEKPVVRYKDQDNAVTIGAGIYNLRDMGAFAQIIHSNISQKEEELEEIRRKHVHEGSI